MRTPVRGRSRGVAAIVPWIGLAVIWQVLSVALGKDAAGYALLPGPADMVNSAPLLANYWPGWFGPAPTREGAPITDTGAVLGGAAAVLATTGRALLGYLCGVAAGVAVAILLSWSRTFTSLFSASAHGVRMVPTLAMVPLFSFWFGAGYLGSILFIAFACFVIVFPVAMAAIQEIPPFRWDSAAAMGASRRQAYFKVIVPAVLPRLKGPALLAVGYAWSAAIAAELLGADIGLGAIVVQSLSYGQSGLLGLAAFIAALCTMASYLCATRIFGWVLRWHEST